VGLLNELTECTAIYERSDAEVRKLEGLERRRGLLSGTLPEPLQITEQGLTLEVDVEKGQKTGLYLDQRDNRERVRTLASGKRVLDAFCYTGGFTLAALQGGAESVTAIESSKPALALVEQHCRMNGFEDRDITLVEADVFEHLRRLRDAVATFDLIILDPPKFAPTAKHAEKASRAYKDINLWAFRLLAPGGLLLTCSCSAGVGPALFRKVIGSAALDAGVEGRVIEVLSPAPDHAGALHFPEGEYLTGLLVRRT
jgi:23S rRNA (cytosine1962-C5)-methyltransferase